MPWPRSTRPCWLSTKASGGTSVGPEAGTSRPRWWNRRGPGFYDESRNGEPECSPWSTEPISHGPRLVETGGNRIRPAQGRGRCRVADGRRARHLARPSIRSGDGRAPGPSRLLSLHRPRTGETPVLSLVREGALAEGRREARRYGPVKAGSIPRARGG